MGNIAPIVISILATFLVTTLADRRLFKEMLKEYISNHEKQMHQSTTAALIEKHEANCVARKDITSIKMALACLLSKYNEDPEKFGLL